MADRRGTPASTPAARGAAANPARRPQPAPPPVQEDDDWQTGAGLADDFIGWISNPLFGVDEEYNAEAVLFMADLVAEDGEPITSLKYSVGSGWEEDQDGRTISHQTKTKINNSSRYGRFIDRIVMPTNVRAPKSEQVKSPAGMENGLGLADIMRGRGSARDAMVWDGLGFRWRLHDMETMGTDDDGNPIVKQVLLPVEYVGTWEERGTAGSSAPAGRAPVAAAGQSNGRTPAGRATQGAAPAGRSNAPAPAARTGRQAPPPVPVQEEEPEESYWDQIPVNLRNALINAAGKTDARGFIRAAGRNAAVLALPEEVMAYVLDSGQDGFYEQATAPQDGEELEIEI